MENRPITEQDISSFGRSLISEEKSANTVEKYLRDARAFAAFAAGGVLTKERAVSYKQSLLEKGYAVRSVNSMLAALNRLFAFLGRRDCRVKSVRQQRQIFCSAEQELTKAEYFRLLAAAKQRDNDRLELMLQTLCSTGVRVSELSRITVEAAKAGETTVRCKGKVRKIFLVKDLKKKLLRYAKEKHIAAGPVFITKNGNPVSRTNVWREMKSLCAAAKVDPAKVFPHNLRHLFARTFYALHRDIAKLSDLLGHSSINTTRIYIISTGSEHRKSMEQMHLIL